MNALLLSAGIGERLKPLTDTSPKCLLPVMANGPLLKYWTSLLLNFGVGRIFINTYWLKEKVIEYVKRLPNKQKQNITIFSENELLPVGDVIEALKGDLGREFLIINSDTYIDPEDVYFFMNQVNFFMNSSVFVGVSWQQEVEGKSLIRYDKRNKVVSFEEKPSPGAGYSYAGISMFRKSFFDYCPSLHNRELTKDIFPSYKGPMFAIKLGRIIDIGGSIGSYLEAHKTLGAINAE